MFFEAEAVYFTFLNFSTLLTWIFWDNQSEFGPRRMRYWINLVTIGFSTYLRRYWTDWQNFECFFEAETVYFTFLHFSTLLTWIFWDNQSEFGPRISMYRVSFKTNASEYTGDHQGSRDCYESYSCTTLALQHSGCPTWWTASLDCETGTHFLPLFITDMSTHFYHYSDYQARFLF